MMILIGIIFCQNKIYEHKLTINWLQCIATDYHNTKTKCALHCNSRNHIYKCAIFLVW